MNSITLETGETAFIFTEAEKFVLHLALRQFNNSLPRNEEGASDD